jgi:BlaR1 peptidase M56
MTPELSYWIKSVFIAGILFGYYLLVLKNKKFHAYNRWYLVIATILSIVLPFLELTVDEFAVGEDNKFITLFVNSLPVRPIKQPNFTPWLYIYFGIIAVSIVLLILLVKKMFWIYRVKNAGVITKLQGVTLIETAVVQAPFSFLGNLFWKQGASLTEPVNQKIFNHELAHIKQGHSYDKLFTQLLTCIYWINPFYWFIQKELTIIHEFLADEASIDPGDTETFALMLLQSQGSDVYLSAGHPFFNSAIKRRLQMLISSPATSFAYARRLWPIPIASLIAMLTTIHLQAQMHVTDSINDPISIAPSLVSIPAPATDIKGNASDKSIVISQQPGKATGKRLKKEEEQVQHEPLNPIPENISTITFGPHTIWLTLVDGTKEQYELNNHKELEKFESRYGSLHVKQ